MQITNKQDIQHLISKYAIDRSVYNELKEPLLYDEGDVWFFHNLSFACINKNRLKYLYTEPKNRGNGDASYLLKLIDAYCMKQLNAVTPVRNESFYTKRGWVITKRFTNYLKITKNYESI